MSKSKHKNGQKSSYEIYQSIRRDWGGLNPVTRIKDSDKIYSRQKNKREKAHFFEEYKEQSYLEEEDEEYYN